MTLEKLKRISICNCQESPSCIMDYSPTESLRVRKFNQIFQVLSCNPWPSFCYSSSNDSSATLGCLPAHIKGILWHLCNHNFLLLSGQQVYIIDNVHAKKCAILSYSTTKLSEFCEDEEAGPSLGLMTPTNMSDHSL